MMTTFDNLLAEARRRSSSEGPLGYQMHGDGIVVDYGAHPWAADDPLAIRHMLRPYGGFVPGRARRPGHLAVLAPTGEPEQPDPNRLVQIASVWFRDMSLSEQLQQVRTLRDDLNIRRIRFDATQGKLRSIAGQDLKRLKATVPLDVDKWDRAERVNLLLENGGLVLLNDADQSDSMKRVDRDLQADEDERVGEAVAFWSIALAAEAGLRYHGYVEATNIQGLY